MTYDATEELKEIMARCCELLPPLEEHHFEILEDIELRKTNAMNSNKTKFFINEIFRHIKEQKVLRTSHMGVTRGGKSEGAQMCALLHVHFFNLWFLKGKYDNVDVNIKKQTVDLSVNNIHRNSSKYLEYVRNSFNNKTLIYGEINIIDEPEKSIGGLGSMSESIELENYNNIVAKYNLGEHWISPRSFLENNTVYGIHWFIKDVKNRVNWGLLYSLAPWSKGISPQSFIGWVCFPLHKNKVLRDTYEEKKNAWIDEVIKGGGDSRAAARANAAIVISEDKLFSVMKSEKTFLLTNDQQVDIIDDYVIKAKIPQFNAEERKRILAQAQLIVKKRTYPSIYSIE